MKVYTVDDLHYNCINNKQIDYIQNNFSVINKSEESRCAHNKYSLQLVKKQDKVFCNFTCVN